MGGGAAPGAVDFGSSGSESRRQERALAATATRRRYEPPPLDAGTAKALDAFVARRRAEIEGPGRPRAP
jgi:hypothetical protein